MRAFLFRLESVLTLRAAKENTTRESHARALQVVARAEWDLAEAQTELERLHKALQSSRIGRFRRNDQIISLNAISYQRAICERQAERLAYLREQAKARLRELLAAKRAHEVLQRLRIKQETEHRRAAERHEQLMVDDLMMARFGARRSEVPA